MLIKSDKAWRALYEEYWADATEVQPTQGKGSLKTRPKTFWQKFGIHSCLKFSEYREWEFPQPEKDL